MKEPRQLCPWCDHALTISSNGAQKAAPAEEYVGLTGENKLKMFKAWKLQTYNQKILTASFFTTMILALITLWYAVATSSMVRIMKADFEISNRPYVSVRTMDQKMKGGSMLFSYSLANSGKTPAILTDTKVIGLGVSLDTEKVLNHTQKATILNPGEFIGADLATITADGMEREYKIRLTIKYKSPSQPNARYSTSYVYRYTGDKSLPLTIIDCDMQ